MNDERLIIATWIYCADSGDKSKHHQVGADIGSSKTHAIYWRCVVDFFRSAAITNPDAGLLLFANRQPPEQVDSMPCAQVLADFGVKTVILSGISRPPTGYHDSWGTQFIIIDVLELLAASAQANDVVLVLDSDCLITRPLGEFLFPSVRDHGVLQYTIDYPQGHRINGLTLAELTELSRSYDPPLPTGEVKYAGGEFVCIHARELPSICKLARSAYQQSIIRHEQGQMKFNEEAHLLSYVYAVQGYPTGSANHLIKRMWTDPFVHRNCQAADFELPIWHLPAEKRQSLTKLYRLGSRADRLIRDRAALARFTHVTHGLGTWLCFLPRAVARRIFKR